MRTDVSIYGAARFWARSRLAKHKVPPEPWFDEEGLARFKAALDRPVQHYLEFGSGGSTRYAIGRVARLVSVESDARYLDAVVSTLPPTDAILLPVDIGLTHAWGRPVFVEPTARRLSKWKRYSEAPWALMRQEGIRPDLVLVDGRFRVACALASLLNISGEFVLLVDDYQGRPYQAIAEFAGLVAMHGRMAEFRPKTDMDRARCREALELYSRDYR